SGDSSREKIISFWGMAINLLRLYDVWKRKPTRFARSAKHAAPGLLRQPTFQSILINVDESPRIHSMARIVSRIPITKARVNLGQVARRAHVNREYFILEKDGIPVAGVLSADELEDYLEMQEPGLKAQIRKSTGEYRRGKSRSAQAFLASLRGKPARSK